MDDVNPPDDIRKIQNLYFEELNTMPDLEERDRPIQISILAHGIIIQN